MADRRALHDVEVAVKEALADRSRERFSPEDGSSCGVPGNHAGILQQADSLHRLC
jgi:hypothetical protein